jgi:wyosine [tRNA(Phe)-imidazoG37] synthetase (radical SAM superfamily)
MGLRRRGFYHPDRVLAAVRHHLARTDGMVDYLAFVPDGEPTLDQALGETIRRLRSLKVPIAVISNAALLWRPDVREDLGQADWVSLKVDTVDEGTWHGLNRPHGRLRLSTILAGTLDFARAFRGELVTETMLVEGMNDGEEEVRRVAGFLEKLKPAKAYLSIPTRPPAETQVQAPDEGAVTRAYRVLSKYLPRVACLTGYEGNAFAVSGNLEEDLLSITAVHPLRKEAVRGLCKRDHAGWGRVEELLRNRQLAEVQYAGATYYTRRWKDT